MSARSFVDSNVLVYAHDAGAEALALIEDYIRWEVVVPSPGAVVEAVRIEERYGISFWDALIVQAAQSAGVERLYSEDLDAGQSYGGVVVVDPFG